MALSSPVAADRQQQEQQRQHLCTAWYSLGVGHSASKAAALDASTAGSQQLRAAGFTAGSAV